MMLRVLVADDEEVARQRLRRLLASAPGIEIVAEAADGVEALEQARTTMPDVVLLDIQMPGLDGLDVARSLGGDIAIIFTTAHDQHAIAAFEAAAADYLLKPVRPERLLEALDRVRARRAQRAPDPAAPTRLCARRGDVLELLDPREVSRLHADAGHVVVTLRGAEYVLDESLATLEQRLAPLGFARTHRSELVNLALVRALHRQDDQAILELADGQRAAVSRAHLPEIKRRLGIA